MKDALKKYALLVFIIAIAVFFNFYKYDAVPACINADEAAQGYNAYSLAHTLKDEHGYFLPLRLKSFNDFKLPLYSYITAPFVLTFGLNDFATRLPARLSGIALVLAIYFMTRTLFVDKRVSYVAALLAALSPWIYIVSRHAHEASLSALFIALSIWMMIRYFDFYRKKDVILSLVAILLATLSYHSARFFLLYIVAWLSYATVKKNRAPKISSLHKAIIIIAAIIALVLPLGMDFAYGAGRVQNLFLTSTAGFQQGLDEYLREDPNRILHNKATHLIESAAMHYMQQISPEFFIIHGDANPRFGMPWLSLITPVEYFFIGIGLYYLFKNKSRRRWFFAGLLFLAPLSNSLTWTEYSLTRIYPMIIPILIIVSYGFVQLFKQTEDMQIYKRVLLFCVIIGVFVFSNINSHDIYFNHYFKRALNTRSWQCGYKDVADFVKASYDRTGKYFITRKYGQPYIFLLYYLHYDPARYHSTAVFTPPDEYGFTQVEAFDKFTFSIPSDIPLHSTIIGFPDDFAGRSIDPQKIKKITYGLEEVFWIYEN